MKSTLIETGKRVLKVEYILAGLAALGSALILFRTLAYSGSGFDFTDEGFYLLWISNPHLYDSSVYLFGFVYHPIYEFLGGNIIALRQANLLITFALALALCFAAISEFAGMLRRPRLVLLAASVGFASSSLLIFAPWLLTPSYNSLALQALLVSMTGILIARRELSNKSYIGWLLIGIGGWLLFMAKPTTALAWGIVAIIFLALTRKLTIRMAFFSLAIAGILLLTTAFLIDGSIAEFTGRLLRGSQLLQQLGGGYSLRQILRIDELHLNNANFWAFFSLTLASLVIAVLGLIVANKKWSIASVIISFASILTITTLSLGFIQRTFDFGPQQGLLILVVPIGIVLVKLVFRQSITRENQFQSIWPFTALFVITPLLYALGTNGNYWAAGSFAGIFWALAGLSLIAPIMSKSTTISPLLPLALTAQLVTAVLLQNGFESPYRQLQSLRADTTQTEFGFNGETVTLTADYSSYISSARNAAQNAGFSADTPVIDLTGQSPGLLFALGAESVGQAWLIGGYPGSLDFAESSLGRIPCEKLASSWILVEKDGPRSVSDDLMAELGFDFPAAYQLAATWQTASGAGGYEIPRSQYLYKPLSQYEQSAQCVSLRER